MPEKPNGKSNLQLAIDQIEEYAERNGFGVFESETGENDVRGDFHVIPCNRYGIAVSPHSASVQCTCNPKCIKEEPVKIFVHNKEI